MTRNEVIQNLLDRGLQLIPLNGKVPVENNWPTRGYTDPTLIATSKKEFWGVTCGPSEVFVLDIDVKDGIGGDKQLQDLVALHGELPDTFTVKTQSGGLHYYFTGPGLNSTGDIAEGIDTKGVGGQVVSPISPGYTIINNSPIVAPPPWILQAVNTKRKEKKEIDNATIKSSDLEQTPISLGNRNNALHKEACFMRGRGYGRDAIFGALQALNENQCEMPLSEEELTVIVSSAVKEVPEKAKQQAREREQQEARRNDFDDYLKEQGESNAIPAYEHLGEATPRTWIVPDWVPEGEIVSLYGSGGSGKSLASMQLAYSVAYGGDWLGLGVETNMSVLAVMCEDDNNEIHRRLNAIRRNRGVDLSGATEKESKHQLYLWSRAGFDTALVEEALGRLQEGFFYQVLEQQIVSMEKGPKLLILDTLSDVFMANENDRQTVNRFIKYHVGRLAKKYELTAIIVAHPSRAGAKEGDILSGSTAWENSVRGRMTLTPHETREADGIMTLRCQKANYAKVGAEVHIIWSEGAFIRAEDRLVTIEEEHNNQILDAIAEAVARGPEEGIVKNNLSAILVEVLGQSKRTIDGKLMEIVSTKEQILLDLYQIGIKSTPDKRTKHTFYKVVDSVLLG